MQISYYPSVLKSNVILDLIEVNLIEEILKSALVSVISWSNTQIFAFENGPNPGTKTYSKLVIPSSITISLECN